MTSGTSHQSTFWKPGMNTTQYFQMWDTAVSEIRQLAPGAAIVGPSLSADPAQNSGEWQTWLAHVKSAGTLPTEISNHLERDGDDPVTVAQSINSDLSADGISPIPLSANEWLPEGQQTAGQSAWYLAVRAGERAGRCYEKRWSGAGSNRRPSAFQGFRRPLRQDLVGIASAQLTGIVAGQWAYTVIIANVPPCAA